MLAMVGACVMIVGALSLIAALIVDRAVRPAADTTAASAPAEKLGPSPKPAALQKLAPNANPI